MSRLKWPVGALVWVIVATQAIALLLPMSVNSAPAGRVGNWFLFGSNRPKSDGDVACPKCRPAAADRQVQEMSALPEKLPAPRR